MATGSGGATTVSGSAWARAGSGAVTGLAVATGFAGSLRNSLLAGANGVGALLEAGSVPRKRMPSSIVVDGLGMLPGVL